MATDSEPASKRRKASSSATEDGTMGGGGSYTNYYEALGVDKDAADDELRRAYKKMAVKWHPDKQASKAESERKEAEEKFKKMAEAYDVLSDPEKRGVYDRYGEEGLKAGGPPDRDDDQGAAAGSGAGASGGHPYGTRPSPGYGGSTTYGGGGAGYAYAGDPSEFFAHFTRASNQRQRSHGETPFDGPGGLEEMLFGGSSGAHHGGSKRHRRSHLPERCVSLSCTLEDLYRGRTRKLKITRKSLTAGRPTEKVLEVPIRPGFKAGTRITYSGEGDEAEPGLAEDIVFVVREVKHPRFVREGDDLHYEVRVSLGEALCGFTHDIIMLDERERIKRLRKRAPVSNITTQVIEGEGMPVSRRPGERGDLIVSFVVDFPEGELTEEQKGHIRAAFPKTASG
ncbi:hypothetical protein ACHAWF_008694 [Thalassiosira exigua]